MTTAAASSPLAPTDAQRATRIGLLYGLGAYLWWGVFPLYLALLKHVPAITIVAHRVVWSLVFLAMLLAAQRRFGEVRAAARSRRTLGLLVVASLLIAVNWFAFIYAVETDRVMQASLGYYINPLITVLLGLVVLRERLRAWQWVSVALAAVGVTYLAVRGGQLPWIALTVATSFAFYGLLRKFVPVGPMVGLTIETAALFPAALGIMALGPASAAGVSMSSYALLMLAGVVTALPLVWFAAAAQRLRLSTLGFLQYLAPTCQFLVAVLVLREPLRPATLTAFAFIWAALAIYTVDSLRAHRSPVRAVEMAE